MKLFYIKKEELNEVAGFEYSEYIEDFDKLPKVLEFLVFNDTIFYIYDVSISILLEDCDLNNIEYIKVSPTKYIKYIKEFVVNNILQNINEPFMMEQYIETEIKKVEFLTKLENSLG